MRNRRILGLAGGTTRRGWLGGSASALGLAVGSRWASAEAALNAGPAAVAAPRILVIGDSMIAGGFGLYLARDLREQYGYEVTRSGKVSSGLARPDFYDWMAQARALVGDRPFDATVVMFGGNDVQGLYMGKDRWIRWQDQSWSEEYARRIGALFDIIAPRGQHVFWVGMPVMRPVKFHTRVQRVNVIYRAEMAIRRHAWFIDIWSVLADDKGRYADRLSLPPRSGKGRRKKVRVRARDGIHLTVAAADYLADYVKVIIARRLSGEDR